MYQLYLPFGRRARRWLPLMVLSLGLSAATTAWGQAQNTGELSGTVSDSAKSVIPGAEITLTNEERGTVLKVVSNGSGSYTFNDLAVGAYTVRVSAPGFETFVSQHVTIDSDAHFRVDAEMKPGSVASEVVVTADAVAADTQSATLNQVIDNQLVENLPIDGNNIVSLAAILPGVTNVTAPNTFTDENGGSSLSVNGARSNSNLFLFDGFLWNNLYLNTGINYPNHAVIAQVSVQLNNFSAQYGRNAGSIFNVVSKGGTNTVHGQVFFHDEDSLFNAQNFFSHSKPPQQTYQYGGAVGGALIKDKLFYEAEYESLVGTTSNQGSAATLTANERGLNADGTPRQCVTPAFAALGGTCASYAEDARAGTNIQTLVYNPIIATNNSSFGTNPTVAISQLQSTWLQQGHTGTSPCITALLSISNPYLPNAEVPSVCFNPVIQNVINRGYIPYPTQRPSATSQFAFTTAQTPRPQQSYGGFIRGDWNITPRHALELRYLRNNNSDQTANGSTSTTTGVTTYEVDANAAYITAGSIGETFVITPNLVNVAKVGYKRYDYNVVPTDTNTLGTLGANFSYPGHPSLPIINVNTRFTLGNAASAYTHSVNQNIEAYDNLNWVHGHHNVGVGVNWLRLQYLNIRDNPGRFNFYGNPGYTNVQASDAIMGLLYSEVVGNESNIAAVQHALYNYIQDTWRATPRLTLNLGVRYEIPWTWTQPNGKAATFIRGYQSTKFPGAPPNEAFVGDPGVPKGLFPTDYTNVSPRIGLAYDVFGNGRTSIRAGFGTFYDAIPATVVGATEPFTYSATYQNPTGSISDPLVGYAAIPAPYDGKGTPQFTAPYSIIFADHNYKNAYTIGANFGFQQQVTRSGILEMNYVGRFARHQMIPLDLNEAIVDCSGSYYAANPDLYCHSGNFGSLIGTSAPYGYPYRVRFPGFNYGGQGVVDLVSAATANYNALQTTFRQRAYRNLTVLANYTYARTLDQQSTLSVSNSTPTPDNIARQYAPSDQNATQIFNLGFTLRMPKVAVGNRALRAVVNDWSFNGIYNARTGFPVNITFGGDESGTDEPSQRPLLLPGYSLNLPSNRHRSDKIAEWFNIAGITKPAAGTLGNISRNSVIGPAYISANLSMLRDIRLARIREGMHAQLRAESFNLFNTVNLGQPSANYSSSSGQASTFGSISSPGTNPNRRVQLGFILYF